MSAPEYIFDAKEKPSLPWHEVQLIPATDESVKEYGCLVDDPDSFEIRNHPLARPGLAPGRCGHRGRRRIRRGRFPVRLDR